MSVYAWTQNLPINTEIYREIAERMGDAQMPGLLVHLAVEGPDGRLQYIDVWESEQACDAAFDAVVHPAVHPVLTQRGVQAPGEPPRTPLKVVEVRYADGRTITG